MHTGKHLRDERNALAKVEAAVADYKELLGRFKTDGRGFLVGPWEERCTKWAALKDSVADLDALDPPFPEVGGPSA